MRATEFFGKQIVSVDGQQTGHVDDLLLDDEHRRAVGVLVSDGLLSKQHVLAFDQVQTAGPGAVIVRSVADMADARDWLQRGVGAHRARSLFHKQVVRSDGGTVGSITDLVLEAGSGRLTALEVAASAAGRAHQMLVHLDSDVQLNKDVVVVPSDAPSTHAEAAADQPRRRS